MILKKCVISANNENDLQLYEKLPRAEKCIRNKRFFQLFLAFLNSARGGAFITQLTKFQHFGFLRFLRLLKRAGILQVGL
jgi:hypothetical protein